MMIAMTLVVLPTLVVASGGCDHAPAPVGDCRAVRGRLSVTKGTPDVRIWPVGTKRLLGVSGLEEHPFVPDRLLAKIKATDAIFGDFVVCPLTPERPGEMQLVCVQSASNLVVRTP
jgi:hypothetical protein